MDRFTIITARRVDSQLRRHAAFLANVSIRAAKQFRNDFSEILDQLEVNPYQFPIDSDPALPQDTYRKALFSKWYKVLFAIENNTVYLDAVVDCRQDPNTILM